MMLLRFLCLLCLTTVVLGKRYYDSLVDDCVSDVKYKRGFRIFPKSFQLVGDAVGDQDEIEVAGDFDVKYRSNYKIVKNLRVNETYVLYQCGTPPPDLTKFPSDVKLFEIPLTNVALADVTSSSFITELNVTDRVKFASGFATDVCLQKITHQCQMEAHSPDSEFADPKGLRIQNRRADAIFISRASTHPKTIAFTATMDPAVIKRAEWVKFVSLFFNKEPAANAFFDKIAKTWHRFRFRKNVNGPTVAWINYQSFDGDEFFIHFAPFKTEFIKAAGGRLLNRKVLDKTKAVKPTSNGYLIELTKKNRTTALGILHEILHEVDVVIDETYQPNNTAYDIDGFYQLFGLKKNHKEFKFAKTGSVYRLDGTVADSLLGTDSLDWFETAVARPDLVLKDLQLAFQTRKHKGHKRIWLRNLSKGELPLRITHKDCVEFKRCNARPSAVCPTVRLSCIGKIEYLNGTDCSPLICN